MTGNDWERLGMTGNVWEWLGGAPTRLRNDETTERRDHGTARPRDCETTRPLKNTGVLRCSQSFSAVRGCARLREVVRGCARHLGVRVVQMWCQVEVWLDGGVLDVHPHSDERAWCRRCAAITTSAWCQSGAAVPPIKRLGWMDSTERTFHSAQ